MEQSTRIVLIALAAMLFAGGVWLYAQSPESARKPPETSTPDDMPEVNIAMGGEETDSRELPKPQIREGMALAEALARRRSVRAYTDKPLTSGQIAELCWAAQGITEPKRGLRTAPSAGALYPLELYVVKADGAWHYRPRGHRLVRQTKSDLREKLQQAALGQRPVGQAPAVFVVAAVFQRTTKKYGKRAGMYVLIEIGHAAQNLLLQATALDLGAVPIGAFQPEPVQQILGLPKDHVPLYLIPVGVPNT